MKKKTRTKTCEVKRSKAKKEDVKIDYKREGEKARKSEKERERERQLANLPTSPVLSFLPLSRESINLALQNAPARACSRVGNARGGAPPPLYLYFDLFFSFGSTLSTARREPRDFHFIRYALGIFFSSLIANK